MVVDDSSMMRKAVCRMLQKLSYEACMAEDGQKCLDSMKEEQPDVVLMDWNMPVMDGLDALKSIKSSNDFNQSKVVMMTTENSQEKIQQALEAGANEYIMKPFDEEVLKEKLDSLSDSDFL